MLRGRKVTDPVVQGASGGGGAAFESNSDSSDESCDSDTETATMGSTTDTASEIEECLTKAWDTVGKVRSELRKMEHRLDEADRHPVQLNQTGETSITDYSNLPWKQDKHDNNDPAGEFASGAVVDNYGRSAYLRSKTHTARKVSRRDDKYVEEPVDRERKKKSKSRASHASQSSKKKAPTIQLQEKSYKSGSRHRGHSSTTTARNATDRRVEFSDHVGVLENHMGNGLHGLDYDRYGNGETIAGEQSTLTDSRDIRETDIHFLNNNLTQNLDHNRNSAHRPHDHLGSRLTHVSVTVPGSSRSTTTPGYSSAGMQRPGPGPSRGHFLDLIPEPQSDMDAGRLSDNSHSDSDSGRGRRFKGDIRHIDPDGLAKIKETIRKQIKSTSTGKENNVDALGASGGDHCGDYADLPGAGAQRLLHDANEPIVPQEPADRVTSGVTATEKLTKVRKIAAGPAAPSYKGFSETEVRYRVVEGKLPKGQDVARKDKKRQVSLKVQEKRIEPIGNWLSVEENDGKSKKITRVIAPSRKPSKQQTAPPKNKEIITTSSWRVGQELIRRELGPVKKKSSKSKDLFTDGGRDGAYSPLEERPDSLVGEEYPGAGMGVGSATAAEIQHHKALSEEARRVYNDLQLDDEDDRKRYSNKENRWKAPVKRKAPKTTEVENQQQPSAKQRHYDQEQVRRYMQRQKAERLKRQKEEDMRQKEEEEARRRQLEELYNKQKQTHSVPKPTHGVTKKEKKRQKADSGGLVTSELPHHTFHTDRVRFMDSEKKENHVGGDDDMEISDSSSTITGDGSMDELTPTGTPRRAKMDIDLPSTNRQTVNSLTREVTKTSKPKSSAQPVDGTSDIRTIGDFSFSVGGVVSKFSQALQEKLNEEPRSLAAGSYSGVTNHEPFLSLPADNRQTDNLPASRADRIQAIKDTAATLQNRLKEEARKIQAQSANNLNENGATSRPSVRWNDTNTRRDREEEFMSKYERVAGVKDDFTVFKSNLPGTQPGLRRPETDGRTMTAATAGKTVHTSGSKAIGDIGEDTTETSTFSEITLTDDSDNEEMSARKIGTGLHQRDFHAGAGSDKPVPLNIPRPATGHASVKASNSWDSPENDDYNVFSIYSRRQQERLIRPGREPMSRKPVVDDRETRSSFAPTHTPILSTSTAGARPAASTGTRPTGSLSPVPASREYSLKSESLRTKSPVDTNKSRQATSASSRPVDQYHNTDDDTLEEEDSYTQSFDTEDKTSQRKSLSERVPPSHKSLPKSQKSTSQKTSLISERMAVDQESSIDEDISQEDMTPRAETMSSGHEFADPARLSPSSLERKFLTEFHNLESMELSLKQLGGVDRTRAVSMAQQETVSLAQMLKAKQVGYDQQMKEIQIKAQIEATEATKQLEDARKRASEAAINAADMIAKVRGEGVSAIQTSTKKLIDTQTEAAKATAEAAKFLSEARAYGLQDTNRLAVDTAAAAAASAVNTALENKWQAPRKTDGGKASGTTRRKRQDDDRDDVESVCSVDDYSLDESMTEDEKEEKSFRIILPNHRKKGNKHINSDNESVNSEGSASHMLDQEFQSLFAGEESLGRFTEDMVRQFMKEEDMRTQHQASLLRLRESALVEKTKAELQWLEQQKHRIRDKGADDSYPNIKKRQRGLKLKLQEQQAEIRRQRQENKATANERKRQLYQKISKRQAKQQGAAKSTPAPLRGRLGRPSEVHTEAEVSSIDEASDAEKHERKDCKSDSEIYTEPKSSAKKSKRDAQDIEKYKKIHLDEKFLTMRQHKLMGRRMTAEALLEWKKRLDAEENRIFHLEKKALKVWDKKDKDPSQHTVVSQHTVTSQHTAAKEETEPTKVSLSSKRDNGTTKDSTIRTDVSGTHNSTILTDNISTARDESQYTSIKESINSVSTDTSRGNKHHRMMKDKSNLKNPTRSGSDSSILEEVPSLSSVDDSKKFTDSSDDTNPTSYGNTFEDHTMTPSTPKKPISSPKSPLDKLKKFNPLSSPRSPRNLFGRGISRNSESESEDSFSHNESQSEMSDFEGRICALNEELRRRKAYADRLKRERKKKKRESMKNKEETLKKQIEAYDNQIAHLKVELQKETDEPAKTTVKPQIKQPKVSPPKSLISRPRADTDSSGPDSTQVSPSVQEEKDRKQLPTKAAAVPPAKISLDKISEASESITSKSDKTESTYKEKSLSESTATESKLEEISEDISSAASESFPVSGELKIDLREPTPQDIWDVSVGAADPSVGAADPYSDDFVSEATHVDKLLSPRTPSQMSNYESKELQMPSARSVTEAISEHIDSMLDSASQPISTRFELKQNDVSQEHDNERDNVSDNSITSPGDISRPSSGRSEQSIASEHETSESEKSSVALNNNMRPETSKSGFISKNIFDIDDLLGGEEEVTPMASPRDTPRDEITEEAARNQANFIDLESFEVGDRVSVTGPSGKRCIGTLLFKGEVQFAKGIWAGVELDKPEGRHNGTEDSVKYFTCRDKHGVFVPDIDMMPASDDIDPVPDVRSSIESTDDDLIQLISDADKNVQMFSEPSPRSPPKKKPNKPTTEELADNITDLIFKKVVKEDLGTINDIAEKQSKRRGPPVAPKPKHQEMEKPLTNGDVEEDINDLENFLQPEQPKEKEKVPRKFVDTTSSPTVESLLDGAIDHMLAIRHNRQNQDKDSSRNDSGNFEEDQPAISPTAEILGVLDKDDDDDDQMQDAHIRPSSPVPGMQSSQDSTTKPGESGIFEGEFDDALWPGDSTPLPYTGGEVSPDIARLERKKYSEEVSYAVPHETEEIKGIVSSAVDEFWTQRRYGEPLTDLQPSGSYFTQEERGSDLISNSKRVFKKLLFDLTGEIVRSIYREEEFDPPVAWHKRKRKQNKHYRGSDPPTTVDVLKPVVQQAVVDILGLNGAKKAEKSKWGVRKKKDLVDSILVQELREEEPDWVNYDEDELAVKMQLTDTIFENLLTDTVHTINKIFRKKHNLHESQVTK